MCFIHGTHVQYVEVMSKFPYLNTEDCTKPKTGCQFCPDPEGELIEHDIINSQYMYFSCSKDECKSEAVSNVLLAAWDILTLVRSMADAIQFKPGNEQPVLILEGIEYRIDTDGDVPFKYLADREIGKLEKPLARVMGKHWLPSEMWEEIFTQTRSMIERDCHINASVHFYGKFTPYIKAYGPNGEDITISDMTDITDDYTIIDMVMNNKIVYHNYQGCNIKVTIHQEEEEEKEDEE